MKEVVELIVSERLVTYVQAYKPGATEKDIERELPYCERKLKLIIEREGDADGKRLETRYLAQLIAEQLRANQYALGFMAKNVQNERARCTMQAYPRTVSTV